MGCSQSMEKNNGTRDASSYRDTHLQELSRSDSDDSSMVLVGRKKTAKGPGARAHVATAPDSVSLEQELISPSTGKHLTSSLSACTDSTWEAVSQVLDVHESMTTSPLISPFSKLQSVEISEDTNFLLSVPPSSCSKALPRTKSPVVPSMKCRQTSSVLHRRRSRLSSVPILRALEIHETRRLGYQVDETNRNTGFIPLPSSDFGVVPSGTPVSQPLASLYKGPAAVWFSCASGKVHSLSEALSSSELSDVSRELLPLDETSYSEGLDYSTASDPLSQPATSSQALGHISSTDTVLQSSKGTVTTSTEAKKSKRLPPSEVSEGKKPKRLSASEVSEGKKPKRLSASEVSEAKKSKRLSALEVSEGKKPKRLPPSEGSEVHWMRLMTPMTIPLRQSCITEHLTDPPWMLSSRVHDLDYSERTLLHAPESEGPQRLIANSSGWIVLGHVRSVLQLRRSSAS